MCTLTYLPSGKDGFILTSNRDASPRETAPRFIRQRINHQEVLFPQEEPNQESWLALSGQGIAACLIDGAIQKHHHNPPYRKSRGQMLIELFEAASVNAFLHAYPFSGIEPFTLVVVESKTLSEVKWDGSRLYTRRLDPNRFHIWSSPQLFTPAGRKKREKWFASWLENRREWHQDAILNFHLKGGDGDPHNDMVLDRYGVVKTMGVASVQKESDRFNLCYLDIAKGTKANHYVHLSAYPHLPVIENSTYLTRPQTG